MPRSACRAVPVPGPVPGSVPGPVPAAGPLPPNHHLWRNGRRWWIAIVLVAKDGLRHRVRRSLGTDDVVVARRRRDALVARVVRARHWRPASEALAAAVSQAVDDGAHGCAHGVRDGVAA